MKFKGTFLMVGVLALLGIGVYFLEVRSPSQDSTSQAAPTPPMIVDLQSESLRGMKIVLGDKTLAVSRDDAYSDWKISEPSGVELDQVRTNAVSASLVQLAASRLVMDKIDNPSDYGLDKPQMTIDLTTTDGQTELAVGSPNPGSTGYYVQRTGADQLYLLPETVFSSVQDLVTSPAPPPTPTPSADETPAPLPEDTPAP